MKNNSTPIRRFRLSRVIGIWTILGAGCAIVLSLFKLIDISRAEEIIITLLGLIAIDLLIERLHILEKIESKLDREQYKPILRKRADIIPPDKMAKNALSIHALTISAYSIGVPYIDFYESKLKEGCDIKFILLDPNSKCLATLNQQNLDYIDTKNHIDSSLRVLKPLSKEKKYKGKFEIRLSDVLFPFSMVGADFGKETGKMIVEIHCFKVPLDSRPHVFLEKEKDPFWFNFYQNQFELAWSNAKKI